MHVFTQKFHVQLVKWWSEKELRKLVTFNNKTSLNVKFWCKYRHSILEIPWNFQTSWKVQVIKQSHWILFVCWVFLLLIKLGAKLTISKNSVKEEDWYQFDEHSRSFRGRATVTAWVYSSKQNMWNEINLTKMYQLTFWVFLEETRNHCH